MAILSPDKTTTLDNGLIIKEYLLTDHNPNKIALPAKRTAKQPLIGDTLHNTDWLDVAANTTPAEQYVRATVNGNMGDTRVHYFVDDKCAWRTLKDASTPSAHDPNPSASTYPQRPTLYAWWNQKLYP